MLSILYTHDMRLTHGHRKLRLAEDFEMLCLTPYFEILGLTCDFKTLRLTPARRQPDARQMPARRNISKLCVFRRQAQHFKIMRQALFSVTLRQTCSTSPAMKLAEGCL